MGSGDGVGYADADGIDLSIALNYGQGTGSAQMLRFVTEHTEAGVSLVSTGNVIDYG